MTVSDFTERELVARIQQRLAPSPPWLVAGIGDDAAVVEPERNRMEVLSVDCLVDGVHFDRGCAPPDAIGHRALAVNLSDLAAMGAAPRLSLLSMALPAATPIADFDGIADGFAALGRRYRTHLVGGNLTHTPGPLTIDVTVVGTVKRRRALLRRGARAGDELYVTGSIGDAAAGLQMLQRQAQTRMPSCVERYLRPEPRVRVGMLLGRNQAASACIDLSDGLAAAVRQLADASGVGATIDAGAIPIGADARQWFEAQGHDPIEAAIAGGDDYELLFAVRPRHRRRLHEIARIADVPLTKIGACTDGGQLVIDWSRTGRSETTPLPAGYGHFRPFDRLRVVPSDVEGR